MQVLQSRKRLTSFYAVHPAKQSPPREYCENNFTVRCPGVKARYNHGILTIRRQSEVTMDKTTRRNFLKNLFGGLTSTVVLAAAALDSPAEPAKPERDVQERSDSLAADEVTDETADGASPTSFVNGAFRNAGGGGGGFRNGGFRNAGGGGGGFRNGGFANSGGGGGGFRNGAFRNF